MTSASPAPGNNPYDVSVASGLGVTAAFSYWRVPVPYLNDRCDGYVAYASDASGDLPNWDNDHYVIGNLPAMSVPDNNAPAGGSDVSDFSLLVHVRRENLQESTNDVSFNFGRRNIVNLFGFPWNADRPDTGIFSYVNAVKDGDTRYFKLFYNYGYFRTDISAGYTEIMGQDDNQIRVPEGCDLDLALLLTRNAKGRPLAQGCVKYFDYHPATGAPNSTITRFKRTLQFAYGTDLQNIATGGANPLKSPVKFDAVAVSREFSMDELANLLENDQGHLQPPQKRCFGYVTTHDPGPS